MQLENPTIASNYHPQSTSHVLESIYSLDDYLSTMPPPEPLTKKQKLNGSSSTTNSKDDAPVPVALGARSSENTQRIHQTCQAYAMKQPQFTYSSSRDNRWSITTEFLGETFSEAGPFNSKPEAKEAACGKAIEMVERLVQEGKISKPMKARKGTGRKVVEGLDDQVPEEGKENEPTVNYIGLLLGTYHIAFILQLHLYRQRLITRRVSTFYLVSFPRLHGLPARHLFLLCLHYRRNSHSF